MPPPPPSLKTACQGGSLVGAGEAGAEGTDGESPSDHAGSSETVEWAAKDDAVRFTISRSCLMLDLIHYWCPALPCRAFVALCFFV